MTICPSSVSLELYSVVADEAEAQQELNMEQEDVDRPFDPSQDAYLMEFLPATGFLPPAIDPSSPCQQTFKFLCENFPAISPAFLQARAEDIGSDEAKLGDFIAQMSSADLSSMPTMAAYKKERRELTDLDQVLAMKPSDFLVEFAPCPHRHFSDLTRVVGQEYADHAYHYLVSRFAGQVKGGLPKVKNVLRSNRNLLLPCWNELEQLPKSKKKTFAVQAPRRGLTQPQPRKMDLDFMKELIFIHLGPRVRSLSLQLSDQRKLAVAAARTTGGLFRCVGCSTEDNLPGEAVLCSGGCQVCSSCVRQFSRLSLSQAQPQVFCSCGGEFSLETLRGLLTASTYQALEKARAAHEMRQAGVTEVKCPACQADVFPGSAEEKILECEECGARSCLACSSADHSPFPCIVNTTKVNVKPSRTVSDEPLQVKFRQYESHFLRQLGGHSRYRIQSMDIVENSRMREEFERKRRAFREKGIPADPIYAYHGTKKDVIGTILQENFDVSKAVRQAHGRGNYFSEFPEKALGYSDDRKQLILCEILPGLSYDGPDYTWPNHNSKLVQPTGPEGYSQMVIIEDHNQILPVAVIHL